MKVYDPARAENHVIRDSGIRERRFEALYTAHYRAIAGYVLRRVAPCDADDVIAQVFAVAWRRFDDVPPAPDDRLWLFGVARNSVADQRRCERRWFRLRARLSQDAVTAGSLTTAADSSGEQVRAAINALRPADREALQLVLWDELSHAEAAAVMGCSPNAFELRYRRARRAVSEAVIAMHSAARTDQKHPVRTQKSRTAPS
jgi:RNA polymerase sigma-70 factor (ECF subfamily)